MKNKKGFSLVELLVVIAIIGVLAGIIVPSVVKYLDKGKENYDNKLSLELETVAKSYFSEHKDQLPNGRPSYSKAVWASFLKDNNYFNTEFKDSGDNSCLNSYVMVEKEDNDYKYITCIVCDNDGYRTKNDYCNLDSNYLTDGTSPTCKSVTLVNEVKYDKYINEDLTIKVDATDDKGISMYKINDIVIPYQDSFTYTMPTFNDGDINVVVIVYDKAGNNTICGDRLNYIIDKTKPKIDSFTIKSNNSSINTKNTTVTIKGSDEGSGVDKVCITTSNDSSTCTWYDMESSTYTNNNYNVPSSDGSGKTDTLYAFVKDKAGNISDSKSINYTLYRYCANTSIDYYGSWGSCSASCGGGTKTRTIYYKDTHFSSQSCGYSLESDSCNTSSCSYSCYKVTPSIGLNCRKSPSTNASIVASFSQNTYHWYKYVTYSGGYYWYYNSTYGCYSVDALQEVSSSYCYSGSTSTGGTTPSGSTITGTCTCSVSGSFSYTSSSTNSDYSCSANGLKSSSACRSFCESKSSSYGKWYYHSSTCKG